MTEPHSLEALKSLPPIPQAVHDILRLVNDPDATISEVGRAIAREPSVTARIIATANSAFFIRQRAAYTIDEAIVRLGLKRVKLMASAMLVGAQFDTARCPAFSPEIYWYHAVRTAYAASRIVAYVPIEVPTEAAYLGGLLHNFGVLLAAYAFPREMQPIFSELSASPTASLRLLMHNSLGFDQSMAGGMLLDEWGLPPEIVAAARFNHDGNYAGPYMRFVQLIGSCAIWVKNNFEMPENTQLFRNVSERALAAVAANCKQECEHLKTFASSMQSKVA